MNTIIKKEPVKEYVITGYKDKEYFITSDGKEFADKNSCERYELRYLWETKVSNTKKSIPIPDGEYCYEVNFYFCESLEEVKALAFIITGGNNEEIESCLQQVSYKAFPQYFAIKSYQYEPYENCSKYTSYKILTAKECIENIEKEVCRLEEAKNDCIKILL